MRKLRNRHPRRWPRHFRPVADMPIRCRPRLPMPLARLVEPHESPSLSADVLTACPACAWRTLLQIALRLAWPWRGYRSGAIDSRQEGHIMHNAIRRSPRAGMRALHVTVSCVALVTYSASGITRAQAACVASAAAPLKPLYGIWAEGYGDYDEHRGPSVRYTSYGVLSGVDHTYFRASGEGFLIGGFAGYNETKGKIGASADTEARSQDIQGAML